MRGLIHIVSIVPSVYTAGNSPNIYSDAPIDVKKQMHAKNVYFGIHLAGKDPVAPISVY